MMNYYTGECDGYFTTKNGTITSPSYPQNYPKNADCVYMISQPIGTVILLRFYTMDIRGLILLVV